MNRTFFLLNQLGDFGQGEYCYSDRIPDGVEGAIYSAMEGEEVVLREDSRVTWRLGDKYRGLKVPSFIGNTVGLLAVHRDCLELIQRFPAGPLQAIPFTLLDHKGRPHAREHVFLNPLGTCDCLHYERSEIQRARSGKVLNIKKWVLDRSKLAKAPELFRPPDVTGEYIFGGDLVAALRASPFTNFEFVELEGA